MLKLKGMLLLTITMVLFTLNSAVADELKDFLLSQLDGKGMVDAINVRKHTIIIEDRLYYLSKNVNVFDIRRKTHVSINRLRPRNKIGFKTSALKKPTAPYDQLITRIWLLPKNSF
ncbi:MAG: hypothetical protein GXP08_05390 [Gammaproteobacteria bacterium]|nr:hypothetical protein [Gammaproteobacteria bacterium]